MSACCNIIVFQGYNIINYITSQYSFVIHLAFIKIWFWCYKHSDWLLHETNCRILNLLNRARKFLHCGIAFFLRKLEIWLLLLPLITMNHIYCIQYAHLCFDYSSSCQGPLALLIGCQSEEAGSYWVWTCQRAADTVMDTSDGPSALKYLVLVCSSVCLFVSVSGNQVIQVMLWPVSGSVMTENKSPPVPGHWSYPLKSHIGTYPVSTVLTEVSSE